MTKEEIKNLFNDFIDNLPEGAISNWETIQAINTETFCNDSGLIYDFILGQKITINLELIYDKNL